MKTYFKVFAFIFSVAILAACTAEESPLFKEARDITAKLSTDKAALDSTIAAKLANVSMMLGDTAQHPDSATRASWEASHAALKMKMEAMSSWTVPTVPGPDAVANLNADSVLTSVKAAQSELEAAKAEVDAMK